MMLLAGATGTMWAQTAYTITKFGAKGDGTTDCTAAINRTIEKCSKKGGGTVIVPAGTFLTGTVYMKSGVELRLEKGAVILGAAEPEHYASLKTEKDLSRYDSGQGTANANCSTDERWTKALILGVGLQDIAITGEGTIDGQHVFDPLGEENMRGPHTIILADCRNVRMEGFSVRRAANYAFLCYALDSAAFEGLHIAEGWDGIHIRGGRNVEISDCRLETGDDAIAGGYWENMLIRDCDINSSCNGVRMIMPSDGLEIKDCRFHGPGVYPHRTSGIDKRKNMLFAISLEPGGWGAAPGDLKRVYLHDLEMDCLSAPVSISIRKECHAHDLKLENICATRMLGTMSPTVCWNDTGFDSITIREVSISR
jgi:hypothetical protein